MKKFLSTLLKISGIVTFCYLGYHFVKGFIEGPDKNDTVEEDDEDWFEDPSVEIEDFFTDED